MRFFLDLLQENRSVVSLLDADHSFMNGSLAKHYGVELKSEEWQRVEGNGSNALDFYIACQLGRVIEKSPSLHCIVLSKDKGFDPLLRHLNKNGLKCKRINSLLELEPKTATTEEPNYKRVFELLSKSEKKSRPRKRATLSQHISSMFQKNIAQADVDRIIDILFANKMISESNNTITYEF